ncbi:MAG: hypothetical protein ACK5NI_02510 [bacterium]|jgi:hypothetical protein
MKDTVMTADPPAHTIFFMKYNGPMPLLIPSDIRILIENDLKLIN